MPTLIKLQGGRMVLANDAFTHVDDDQDLPPGDVIISLSRFQADGDRLLGEGRSVGVRLQAGQCEAPSRSKMMYLASAEAWAHSLAMITASWREIVRPSRSRTKAATVPGSNWKRPT